MPIIVKDYEWSESDTRLDLCIPQKGIRSKNVDVMVTKRYIKVNYSPYFFDLHLKEEIDVDKTRVVIADEKITFHLIKQDPVVWKTLVNHSAKDPSTRRELVAAAYKYHEDKIKKDAEQRANVKAEQNKMALRTAMDQESGEKDRIEAVKQSERDKVAKEMDEWQNLDDDERTRQYLESIKTEKVSEELKEEDSSVKKSLESTNTDDRATSTEECPNTKSSVAEERAKKFERIRHNLANPLLTDKKYAKSLKKEKKKEVTPMWEGTAPRQQKEITVSFTPRFFPSAARESTAAEEEAWYEKNIRAQMAVKPKDTDTKEEERNPVWLSDKASVFYKMGNFPAAINAYSEAINISPSLPKLYINRASCYIVLNLYEDAVMDCTRALDLLTPPVEANRLSRVRTLAKRGSALCQLGSFQEALKDYELAYKLSPENESLKQDLDILRTQMGHGSLNEDKPPITVT